jgi:hypothetical protein
MGFSGQGNDLLGFSGIREMVYRIYRNNILKNIIDTHWRAGPWVYCIKGGIKWTFVHGGWTLGLEGGRSNRLRLF